MIGPRISGDKVDPTEICLTILVDRKVPPDALRMGHKLPRRLRYDGVKVPVDVVEIGRMEPQASKLFPIPGPLALELAEHSRGTIGALCNVGGKCFALTCGHVIPNGAFGAPTACFSTETKSWIPIGVSSVRITKAGSGMLGDGYVDVGLIDITHTELIARASHASFIQSVDAYIGQRLVANDAVMGKRYGEVTGLHMQINDPTMGSLVCDIVVAVQPPGTYRGDSGMLWKDEAGSAVAIHGFGEPPGPSSGSARTAAMLARRAQAQLAISTGHAVHLTEVPN
jgi:hypothetical protein